METDKIKKDMMELWKETFHDSFHYIRLVFDTYFTPDNAFTVYDGEKLIAALLGVEYEFYVLNENNQTISLKGLYLCGLATHPEYRKRGIMAKLMNEAEISAKSRGFSISFLIPADSHLREYYCKKGYETTSFRLIKQISRTCFDNKSKMNIYTFRYFFDEGNYDFLNELAQWCREREKPNLTYVSLKHSRKDFVTIMLENENSFFLTEPSFDPKYPILAKVRAVVFPAEVDEKNHRWRIVGIFLRDVEEFFSEKEEDFKFSSEIFSAIQSLHSECKLELCLSYIGTLRGEVEPYAMVKFLDRDEISDNFENLPFNISLMLD